MNDTYWERLLISNIDMLETQKEIQAIAPLAFAGGLSTYKALRSPSFS